MFRTYEPIRDRLVAVKVFRLDITPEQSQVLADELGRAADAGLFHPSIVEPLAAGVEGTVAYRAEEYVAAESLDVAMRHYAPAPAERILPFITQLAGAIDFARASGVGHGGLHPRDIFLTPDEARVTGFGVVDALERVGLRAPVRRPYSAPERVAGVTWGTPADVFSLGAIAFELLTGRRPAGTGDQIGPLDSKGAEQHSAGLRDVLVRAMAEDPASRYPAALAFAAALEAATHASPAASGPAPALASPLAPGTLDPAATTAAGPELPVAPVDLDDISAERETDEAHWALSQTEQHAQVEREATDSQTFFDDGAVEAAADRLAFDAADLALTADGEDRRFADDFSDVPAAAPAAEKAEERSEYGLGLEETPEEEYDQPVRHWDDSSRGTELREAVPPAVYGSTLLREPVGNVRERAASDTRRSSDRRPFVMWPLALALVALLLAFGLGYMAGGRDRQPPMTAAGGAEAPVAGDQEAAVSSPAAAGEQGGGREWSEQTVTPAAGQPPAAAPAVPLDAPADVAVGKTETAPPVGRLVVRSTPRGANVTVNGTWRGRTPLTLTKLALGDYDVRVVANGYDVARERLKLSESNASRTMTVQLRRQRPATPPRATTTAPRAAAPRATAPAGEAERFSGAIYVDSRPRGAKVYINGKEFGTTPLRVPEIPIGSHVVRLELPDHRTWTASVRVAAGETERVTGSLDPIR